MNFLLVTIGSHGDVHPFIGMGAALKKRGHDVTVISNAYFQELARREGIDFEAFATVEQYLSIAANPNLWSKRRGFRTIVDSLIEITPRVYELVAEHVRRRPGTVVIASSLALPARIAQDELGFKMATVHLSPGVFRSSIAPPSMPGLFMPRWLPRRVKDWMWEIGDRHVIDPQIAPRLNAFRATLGLPPVQNIFRDWWNSPDLVVGMFPEWFAKPQADWPSQTKVTSFPLYDERGHAEMSRELIQFLDRGEAPIAFTPGSAMFHAHDFFETAARACARLGRRGILLSRHREHIPSSLPPGVIHVNYAPFSELLPRVAALVHHGGIGTTAQALAAGVPQLIMPMSHDQFDNAARVRTLGAGDQIARSRFRSRAVARKLANLLSDATIHINCRQIAQRFVQSDGITRTCQLVEQLAAK